MESSLDGICELVLESRERGRDGRLLLPAPRPARALARGEPRLARGRAARPDRDWDPGREGASRPRRQPRPLRALGLRRAPRPGDRLPAPPGLGVRRPGHARGRRPLALPVPTPRETASSSGTTSRTAAGARASAAAASGAAARLSRPAGRPRSRRRRARRRSPRGPRGGSPARCRRPTPRSRRVRPPPPGPSSPSPA